MLADFQKVWEFLEARVLQKSINPLSPPHEDNAFIQNTWIRGNFFNLGDVLLPGRRFPSELFEDFENFAQSR